MSYSQFNTISNHQIEMAASVVSNEIQEFMDVHGITLTAAEQFSNRLTFPRMENQRFYWLPCTNLHFILLLMAATKLGINCPRSMTVPWASAPAILFGQYWMSVSNITMVIGDDITTVSFFNEYTSTMTCEIAAPIHP